MTGNEAGATRERILDAAMQAVSDYGIKKLAMTDIGESARLSRGTLYRYFPNRESLLQALFDFQEQRFLAGLRGVIDGAPSSEDGLWAAIEFTALYMRTHPGLTRLADKEPEAVVRMLRERMTGLEESVREILAPLIVGASNVPVSDEWAAHISDWLLRLSLSYFLLPSDETRDLALRDGFAMLLNKPRFHETASGRAAGRRTAAGRARS